MSDPAGSLERRRKSCGLPKRVTHPKTQRPRVSCPLFEFSFVCVCVCKAPKPEFPAGSVGADSAESALTCIFLPLLPFLLPPAACSLPWANPRNSLAGSTSGKTDSSLPISKLYTTMVPIDQHYPPRPSPHLAPSTPLNSCKDPNVSMLRSAPLVMTTLPSAPASPGPLSSTP